jgi:nitrilase
VFGPDGRLATDPLTDAEGIVYAELDLEKQVSASMMHDITGHYNQFGVLALRLNRSQQRPVIETAVSLTPQSRGTRRPASRALTHSEDGTFTSEE